MPAQAAERAVGRGARRSTTARATRPAGAVTFSATFANGVAAARAALPTGANRAGSGSSSISSGSARAHSRAARSPASGRRPAASVAATIEPARRAEQVLALAEVQRRQPASSPFSTPRSHASPSVPPAPSTKSIQVRVGHAPYARGNVARPRLPSTDCTRMSRAHSSSTDVCCLPVWKLAPVRNGPVEKRTERVGYVGRRAPGNARDPNQGSREMPYHWRN